MPVETPIRWGMIGCGAVTEMKSGPAYQLTPDFELVAVMARNKERAQHYAERHGVPHYFDNADDVIFSNDIDAIYIATPPDSHTHFGLKVAAAGKPCCIEKPLAPTFAECTTLVNAFKQRNLPLFVAYYRRSLPRFNKIKALIDQGQIGTPRQIHWQLSRYPGPQEIAGEYQWRTDKHIAPAGYFDDLASHGLDLFAYLLGNYQQATGFNLNQQGYYTASDAVAACWLHQSGVAGTGSWNFGCAKRQDTALIQGSHGEIRFAVFADEPIVVESESGTHEFHIENPKHIQQYHVKNMRNSLIDRAQHPSTGDSALHTSWVMDCILK